MLPKVYSPSMVFMMKLRYYIIMNVCCCTTSWWSLRSTGGTPLPPDPLSLAMPCKGQNGVRGVDPPIRFAHSPHQKETRHGFSLDSFSLPCDDRTRDKTVCVTLRVTGGRNRPHVVEQHFRIRSNVPPPR
jgi:hypothetical protein